VFTAADFAKRLFDRFGSFYSESRVFLRSDSSSVCIHGHILVTFSLSSDKSELLVLLDSNSLDGGYVSFVSNGGVDEVYGVVSQEARDDRAKTSRVLRDASVVFDGGKCKYRCSLNTRDADMAFRAVFNECIRPALYYARKRGDKI